MTGIETALLIAGAAVSAYSAISTAQANKDASDYNAAIARQNATIATDQGNVAAEAQRRRMKLFLGNMKAQQGASGIVANEGTPLDLLAQSAAQGELDAQTIGYNARLKSLGYTQQATLDEFSGQNAMRKGYLDAGSAILTGASKYMSYDYSRNTSGPGSQLPPV